MMAINIATNKNVCGGSTVIEGGRAMISVVIPVFNSEKTIERCIESVINQTYRNLQIIIVDDGSNDGSGEICDRYAGIDNRILVIHQDNGGVTRARKVGLSKATGDYIGFVDSDDYAEPDLYQRLYELLIKTRCDFIHSGFISVSEKNGKICPHNNYKQQIIELDSTVKKNTFIERYLYSDDDYRIDFSMWSKLFKAQLIKSSFAKVPNSITLGEDGIAFFNCVKEADSLYMLPECHYNYVVHDGSVSHNSGVKYIFQNIVYLSEFLRLNGFQTDEFNNDCSGYVLNTLLGALRISGIDTIRFILTDKTKYEGKNVILYGAGDVGKDYYRQLKLIKGCNVIGVYDSNYTEVNFEYEKVKNPDSITNENADYIIVAVKSKRIADNIIAAIKHTGIKSEIVWNKPENVTSYMKQ